MRMKQFVLAGFAGLLLAVPADAANQPEAPYGDAIAVLFAIDPAPLRQLPDVAPVRQTLAVTFRNPVKVRDYILMGRYIIEHDTDRMARGEPCTHIYEYDNPSRPVVAFHCVHLTRPRTPRNTVSLISRGELPVVMTEFQFAGDSAAHGLPRLR